MFDKNSAIGVIDSGVGGISVLKELINLMPYENYFYFGDNINAPYGTKTTEEIQKIMLENTQYLISKNIKLLVIACNTATGAAAGILREKYNDLIIVGIEPAIKPSTEYKDHSTVLVMATPLTLKQEKFLDLADKFENDANIIPLPCPGLMELVEDGQISGDKIDNYLADLFSDFKDKKIDSVVLGCTHYPHIKDAIKKALGDNVMVFDGGEGTAKEVLRRLEKNNLLNDSKEQGKLVIESSDKDNNIKDLAMKLLKI